MEGGKGSDGGVVGESSSSKVTTSFVQSGDRKMFTVELRPGRTSIVSWKKLMKDANRASESQKEPPANAHPALESRIAPAQPSETEMKDATAPNRFSAVIEKIERLYMGKQSSDEEDLGDVPDDDQYDTEDSFIDDAELDEYFEVDNSAIKHNGFFVNRGKLERIEHTSLPNQQPKKRRRLAKAHGEREDVHQPNKQLKGGKKTKRMSAPSVGKNVYDPFQGAAVRGEHQEDEKCHNQMNAVVTSFKKRSDCKAIFDPSLSSKVSNGDAFVAIEKSKDAEKNLVNKLKDASNLFDASVPRYQDRSSCLQSKHPSSRQPNNVDELDQSGHRGEKNGISNISEGSHSKQMPKASHMHRKDAPGVRPKGSSLEKAIRELEKMVAESRPPTMEVPDADTSAQAVKRRLPREIKQKLAKVARLAASHGKLSQELLGRLMSIVGHLMQLRTLKRNLKIMINTGLLAKQEKDDRFQRIKKEASEMIKMHVTSKEFEQQAGKSGDFQAFGPEDKTVKKISCMDEALEDKICDLYDLFVDGLDEDVGPQIRKLYAELAGLWPNGYMDNHGIKHGICRAKERKRARYGERREQENMRRKKLLAPKTEETVRAEPTSVAQTQYVREKLATDPSGPGTNSPSRLVPGAERVKHEKMKGTSGNSPDNARSAVPKKVKRKSEQESAEAHTRAEKSPFQHGGEERQKPNKQAAAVGRPFPEDKPTVSCALKL